MAASPAVCRIAGVKSGESWPGPTPGTAPGIGREWVRTAAVGSGQARCRWPFPFARRAPKQALTRRVSSPFEACLEPSTAATGARSIRSRLRTRRTTAAWVRLKAPRPRHPRGRNADHPRHEPLRAAPVHAVTHARAKEEGGRMGRGAAGERHVARTRKRPRLRPPPMHERGESMLP